jgi:hypothetical protein
MKKSLFVPVLALIALTGFMFTACKDKEDSKRVPTITWGGTGFVEGTANDGAIAGTVTATLANGTFTGADGVFDAANYDIANIPNNLKLTASKTSATVISFTLTGTANAHSTSNSVSNIRITFKDAAFASKKASAVTNYSKSDIAIAFKGKITWDTSPGFTGDKTSGDLTGTVIATLSTGDTFADTTPFNAFTVANLPSSSSGTAPAITADRTDAQTITFTLKGTTDNKTDVNSLTITFTDTAFTGTTATAANVIDSSKNDLTIKFS